MAQTTPRESLTCLAFSYFAKNGLGSKIQEFSDAVYEYYINGKEDLIKKFDQNLIAGFNLNRILKLYSTKADALRPDKEYNKSSFEKDFPDRKNEVATKLDGEIKSAFVTAEAMQKSSIVSNLSKYKFYDQSTDFMKKVKDDALEKTVRALDLPKDVGSDILSSIDILMVKSGKEKTILDDFEKNIIGSQVSQMDILNNLAYGNTGQNTFRTLTNKYFDSKDMVGISLKKASPNKKADLKIIGTIFGARGLEIYLDPYTEFLGKISQLKTKAELYKLVNDLVEIDRITPTDGRTYFSVNYKLNYKNVNISDKIVKIDLQIGRSGFNAGESGKMGFVGGASYVVTLPILKRYPKYNEMVREIISIREKAFHYAVDTKKLTSEIRSSYKSALNIVKMNELVLYSASDNEIIKTFCEKYDVVTKNKKDSYQQYRIAVSKLCKNRALTSSDGILSTLDKKSNKVTGTPKTLQNDYVHSQGLWMYTRKGEDLKNFFKQQITLTLYGLMSKKGSKIFYSKNQAMLTEDAFVKEFKSKNNQTKLAKFVTAPYVMID